MSEILHRADQELAHWARYRMRGADCQGYASTSPEFRLMRYGASAALGSFPGLSIDERAERVGVAVFELARADESAAEVLVLHYLGQGPVQARIDASGLSKSAYYKTLEAARMWVAGWLRIQTETREVA